MDPVRVGLLGVRDGLPYLHALRHREDIRLAAICDRETEALGEAAKRFEVPLAVTSDDRLFGCPELEAVIIAGPDRLRRKHLAAALEAGRHVYCALPAALAAGEAAKLAKLQERYPEQRVMVDAAHRYHPFPAAARRTIGAGELGTLYHLRLEQYEPAGHYDQPDSPRADPKTGTPPLLGPGLAALDLAVWLAGDLAEVRAHGARRILLRLPFHDTVEARFTTATGTVVEVFLALGARRPRDLVIHALGTAGSLNGSLAGRENAVWTSDRGELSRHCLPSDPTAGCLPAALDEFFGSIRDGRPPSVGLADAARSLLAGAAALASAAADGAPVKVPEIGA